MNGGVVERTKIPKLCLLLRICTELSRRWRYWRRRDCLSRDTEAIFWFELAATRKRQHCRWRHLTDTKIGSSSVYTHRSLRDMVRRRTAHIASARNTLAEAVGTRYFNEKRSLTLPERLDCLGMKQVVDTVTVMGGSLKLTMYFFRND